MTLLLLVRHGENDYVKTNRLAGRLPGVHLNARGRQQAENVAALLTKVPLAAIYASPLERTLETAAPLAAAKGLEVIPRPGLIEVDCGAWQGKKLKGLSRLKLWKIVQGAPSAFQFPDGETFVAAQTRICQELRDLAARHGDNEVVAVFGHSDPIKLAVAFYLGLPLDLFQRVHVSPASITALMLGEMGGRILTLNYDPDFWSFPDAAKDGKTSAAAPAATTPPPSSSTN
jgi:probable phosphoglycerate mutase